MSQVACCMVPCSTLLFLPHTNEHRQPPASYHPPPRTTCSIPHPQHPLLCQPPQVFINLQGKKTLSKSAPVPTSPLAASASNKAATTQLFECPTATKPGGLSCKAPDADAAKAAAFSLQQINAQSAFVKGPAALVSVIPPYASQVVAGRNLYATFVTSTSDGAAAIVQSKVWYKLDGKMELTSWQVLQQAASAGTAQSAAAGAGGAAGGGSVC